MSDSPRRYFALSVHDLVDPILRVGDIDNRVYNQETMAMGTILHAKFQEKQGNEYLSEYPLTTSIDLEDATFVLQGRADGIILGGPYPVIDEIKSTVMDLELFHETEHAWHEGQALCYAYMYLKQTGGKKAEIRLTYLSQVDGKTKTVSKVYSFDAIEKKVLSFCKEYRDYSAMRYTHFKELEASIKDLKFPFAKFRKGQREMAKYVYGTIKNRGLFFAEAPTGTGKTISSLYPAVKSFAEGKVERIFYLTAKNTGEKAAYEAMGALMDFGLVARDSYLVSKEKICFCPGKACNPDECPYAKGYYGKLRGLIKKALSELKRFDSASVEEFCEREAVCPFEFQLDLSLEADVIVADYNYFIDPIVYLQRYFGEDADGSKSVVLFDEAHNLVERTRDCYSAEIGTAEAKAAKKSLKGDTPKALKRSLSKIEKALSETSEEEGEVPLDEPPSSLDSALESYKGTAQRFYKAHPEFPLPQAAKDFSRDANRYRRIRDEQFDSSYRVFARKKGKDVSVKLYCIDPAPKLLEVFKKVRAIVAFSATLSPLPYFEEAISGNLDSPSLLLPSPFPKENFKLLIAPKISTRYKDRAGSVKEVASYLSSFVKGAIGNYFFYFPSYEYLELIKKELSFPEADVYVQDKAMDRFEKQEFLDKFQPHPSKTTIGLLLLGGAFSEGIDLVDDRLIGVAVVGVGLPQVGFDNDLIRSYYDEKGADGFDFAYKNPGMNKVMQAVGRLIRSETDRGVALLIDDHYMREEYRSLFTRIYQDYEVVLSEEEILEAVKNHFE